MYSKINSRPCHMYPNQAVYHLYVYAHEINCMNTEDGYWFFAQGCVNYHKYLVNWLFSAYWLELLMSK